MLDERYRHRDGILIQTFASVRTCAKCETILQNERGSSGDRHLDGFFVERALQNIKHFEPNAL